jgi:hypothetical protein
VGRPKTGVMPATAPFTMPLPESTAPPPGGIAGAVLTMLAGAGMAAGCIAALASGWLASISPPATAVTQQATMNGFHDHDRYSFMHTK